MTAHVGVPAHPLDEPCPCGHAQWIHTTRCLALRRGVNQRRFSRCECGRALKEFG